MYTSPPIVAAINPHSINYYVVAPAEGLVVCILFETVRADTLWYPTNRLYVLNLITNNRIDTFSLRQHLFELFSFGL